MKQQILIIHGGNAFETYDEYLEDLRDQEVSLDRLRKKGWKQRLGVELGEGFEVFSPMMPNGANARYSEWEIYFKKLIPLMEDGLILIGHSLGGIFLVKYFSENTCPKKIKAVFLVAAPYNTKDEHPLVDFNLTENIKGLSDQCPRIFIYHSKDDMVVPFSNAEKYMSKLTNVTTCIFENRGHFNDEHMQELLDDIRGLE